MKTIILKVVEELDSPVLLSAEKGERLKSIVCEIVKDNLIIIDFEGYKFLSSSFLNSAFGQICIDLNWDSDTFHRFISLKNLKKDDFEELNLAVLTAIMRKKYTDGKIDDSYYSSLMSV